MNPCEVYYDFWRALSQAAAESAINDLLALGLEQREDLDPQFWREVARIKAIYRRVSLADCCALTLAGGLNATLVTADRRELEPLRAAFGFRINSYVSG